jgi:hypothetical protein
MVLCSSCDGVPLKLKKKKWGRLPIYQHMSPKVDIRNFSPHLRNSAILRTTKSIAELRTKKNCGTAIVDLQNLTSAIPQLSAVSGQFHYFLVPFPQLRMVSKSNQQYF